MNVFIVTIFRLSVSSEVYSCMSLYEMNTLATGLFGLRSTFRAAFAGLNQYMIRELKQALIVTQIAKLCLILTTFLLSLLLLVIYS